MAETLTTELEAVNTMLDCINESPVSTLEVTGVLSVALARSTLAEVSRKVQERGWHFNSETEYPLTRDTDNEITLPQNTLRVDTTSEYSSYNVAQRGLRLYWKDEFTYAFDANIEVDIVFYLPWDELPQAARDYIAIRAARVFQARQLGSDTRHKFSELEEYDALAAMQSAEADNADYNMFSGSWSVANILNR
jgi:hypothetical protein